VHFSHVAPHLDLTTGAILDFELAGFDESGILTGTYTTGMVVDSGAELSLLGGEVATALGIDLSERRYPKSRVKGVVPGQFLPTAEAHVLIRICDRWFKVPVRFPTVPSPVRALLGRHGVFDRVTFAFRHDPGDVLAVV
jgi:hypothetical protein